MGVGCGEIGAPGPETRNPNPRIPLPTPCRWVVWGVGSINPTPVVWDLGFLHPKLEVGLRVATPEILTLNLDPRCEMLKNLAMMGVPRDQKLKALNLKPQCPPQTFDHTPSTSNPDSQTLEIKSETLIHKPCRCDVLKNWAMMGVGCGETGTPRPDTFSSSSLLLSCLELSDTQSR